MYKKITFFALFISIVGFIMEFFDDYNSIVFQILAYFSYNISTGAEIFWIKGDLLRLFFNFILFIGGIAFYFSKEKETRILRFVFSVLFVEHCFFAVLRIYKIIISLKLFVLKDFLISSASFCLCIFILYFLSKSMQYMNEKKALDYETFVYTESTEIAYFPTNKWQRLLHYIIDTMIFGIIGFQFLDFLIRTTYFNAFFERIQGQFSERVIFWILVFLFRTLFYFVFETLFSATPGKFLTESKVTDDEGLKPEKSSIFKRSLLRSVPLNSVTFLFNSNWHDNYSETQVYKEKKTGVAGSYYFLIIPFFGILCYSMYLWEKKKENDSYYEHTYEVFEEKKSEISDALKIIDTNTVLQLKNSDNSSRSSFLKVRNISNSTIDFSILNLHNESNDALYLKKNFEQSKDTLKKITINRSDLQKMVITEFVEWPDYYFGDDKRSFKGLSKIPELEGKNIAGVLQLNSPNLVVHEANFDSTGLSVYLQNKGIPAEVISITSDNKNINWNLNILPSKFPTYGSVYLRAKGEDITEYNMKVVIIDSLKRRFIYEIYSTDNPQKAKIRLLK